MRKEKGITLIALIITIIIMLILAGVVINLTIGENGLFKTAKQAGKDYKKAAVIEEIKLKILEQEAQGKEISLADLLPILAEHGTIIEKDGQIVSIRLEDGTEIEISEIYKGTTTEDKIICIYTKEQLEDFRDNVNNGKTYENEVVMLMNNINLQGNENEKATWWEPIGLRNEGVFCGTFIGNNYKISNLYISDESNNDNDIAFFGYVKNATIKNVIMEGNVINSNKDEGDLHCVSGIVGRATGKVLIENCINNVNITNVSETHSTGGIVSIESIVDSSETVLTIKKCINNGKIIAGESAGGIIGYVAPGCNVIIEDCSNYGNIEARANAGRNQPWSC